MRPSNDSKVNGQRTGSSNPLLNKYKQFIYYLGSKSKKDDRKRWKTLRDFVDDQAIEDALEMVESDRSALDVRSPR